MLLLTITKMLTSFAILSTMVPLQLVLAKDKKTPDSNSNNTMSFKTNNTNSFDGNHTNETIITSTKINKKSTNSSNDASSGDSDVGSSETLPVALPLVGCKWFNSLNLKVAIYEILKTGYNFRWGSTRTTLKPIQASLTLSSASRVKVKISRRVGSADFPALFFIYEKYIYFSKYNII